MKDIQLSRRKGYILFPGDSENGIYPTILRIQDILGVYPEDTKEGYFLRFILTQGGTLSVHYKDLREARDSHLESLYDLFLNL